MKGRQRAPGGDFGDPNLQGCLLLVGLVFSFRRQPVMQVVTVLEAACLGFIVGDSGDVFMAKMVIALEVIGLDFAGRLLLGGLGGHGSSLL